jgi:DNA-binding NarL/FixJ family response regulator
VVTGANAYSFEADVRVFGDVASTLSAKGGGNESVAPGVIVGQIVGEESLLDALNKGVSAFVPQDVDRKTLEDVLIRVAGGECMLLGDIGRSKKASKLLVAKLRQIGRAANGTKPAAGANPFSERERQIITGIAKGLPSPVIAGELRLSVQTVKNYVTGILTKTGARNRAHAVAVATDRGWLN